MTGLETALIALTMNIFMESRGEPMECQRMVADTVITRSIKLDKPPSEVVLAYKQYSWTQGIERTREGLFKHQRTLLSSMTLGHKEFVAMQKASDLARKVLAEGYRPKYGYTHFHTKAVRPDWSIGKKGVRCGDHIFYRNIAM